MRRAAMLGAVVALAAAVGSSAVARAAGDPPTVPAPGNDWPQFRGGPWHGGVNPYESILGPANVGGLQVKWEVHIPPNVVGSAVVAGGVVYVGSEGDDTLYALHETDGTPKWKVKAASFVGSTPAVSNGLVFLSAAGTLYALHEDDGSLAWSALGGDFSSPTVAGGVVYVGSSDGLVDAYSAADGLPLWQAALGGAIFASPAVADGTLYIGTSDGTLFALDAATGATRWTYAAGAAIFGSAAVRAGAVYATTGDGTLFALDRATGTLRWSRHPGDYMATSPAVTDDAVYVAVVAGGRNAFEKIEARRRSDGRLLWSYHGGGLLAGGVVEPSPSVADGVVYATSYDGTVRAFEEGTGALLWQHADVSGIFSSPAVVDGQVLVAGGGSGDVFDFALP